MELYENHSDCLSSNLKLSEISILTFSQFYFKINRIQLEIVVSSSKKAKYYYFSLNICKKIFLGFIFFIASTPPPQKKKYKTLYPDNSSASFGCLRKIINNAFGVPKENNHLIFYMNDIVSLYHVLVLEKHLINL